MSPDNIKKDPIKEAFARAKQDIFDLQAQLYALKQENTSLKQLISEIPDILQQQTSLIRDQQEQIKQISKEIIESSRQTSTQANSPAHESSTDYLENPSNPAQNQGNQTNQHINPAQNSSFNIQDKAKLPQYALKTPYTELSTGNKGVPADRQTHRQADINPIFNQKTDFSKKFSVKIPDYTGNKGVEFTQNPAFSPYSQAIDSIESLRADLKDKFKHLTQQEFAVFAAIYQLEEEGFIVDYPLLASKLKLTESSIRDYAQKLIKKGVPIQKTKENNKRIFLSIDQNLKKIASLPSILALRES